MKCFIDTNSLIHYTLFTEVDWLTELNLDEIELVICSTVLHELDEKKLSANSEDLRNRCRKIVSKLGEFESGSLIRDKVKIIFSIQDLNIDWDKEGLNFRILDDRIIATILSDEDFGHCSIITADLGLKLKAESRKINTLKLGDHLLVEVIQNKKNKEIIKLREKIASLEDMHPKVTLKILDNEEQKEFIKFNIIQSPEYNDEKTQEELKNIEKELKYSPPNFELRGPSVIAVSAFTQIPEKEEIERYETDVKNYIEKLNKYYNNKHKFGVIKSRSFELNLILCNESSKTANEINIDLHFPDGFNIIESADYPFPPSPPKEPIKPMTKWERIGGNMQRMSMPFNHFNMPTRHEQIESIGPNTCPSIKKTNSYNVTFNIDHLKHRSDLRLDPLVISFSEKDEFKSFAFDYKIVMENVPTISAGELNMIFIDQ